MSVSINNIIDISVQVSSQAASEANFSTGLIIGNSEVLDAENRVAVYTFDSWQQQMTDAGFTSASPEYIAANAYFSQSPAPKKVCIGVKLSDDSAEVDAVNACRQFSDEWFAFCFCYDVEDTKKAAIAEAVEAYSIPTVFIYQTKDTNCLKTGQENVMKTMMDANYNYTVGFYSTQQYITSAIVGLYSALNTTDDGSAYTIAFKSLVGFTAESINDTQYSAILSYKGNVYTSFGDRYTFMYPGNSAAGTYMDELFFIEVAKYLIQDKTMNGLITSMKIPQTESGMNQIISFITTACNKLLSMGYIDTGIWNGQDIMDLKSGMAVTNGYFIQAESIYSQSQSDRQERIAPPIYVALKTSGAIQSVVIRVLINR